MPTSSIAAALLAALVSFSAATVLAFVVPLRAFDGALFPATASGVVVDAVHVSLEPAALDAADDSAVVAGEPSWTLDATVRLRNVSAAALSLQLAVLDVPRDAPAAEVWIDGAVAAPAPRVVRPDPALPEQPSGDASVVSLSLPLGGAATVRVRHLVRGTIDGSGQVSLRLPTHALGLFDGAIGAAWLSIGLPDRPVALQATISGGTVYAPPAAGVAWYMAAWQPRHPFQLSYLSAWSALLLVAEAEACPPPWQVIRDAAAWTSASAPPPTDAERATLAFCATLPEVFHGRPFDDTAVQTQLGQMTLDRYVPGAAAVPMYAPSAGFREDAMSDAESIYARLLRGRLR